MSGAISQFGLGVSHPQQIHAPWTRWALAQLQQTRFLKYA
jgi:hypothetical protein